MSVLRTPDVCFDNLPLWDYEPQYFTSTLYGLEVRIAYYDLGEEGAEETILLTHGMSSWSYLYRRMIPPLVRAGHRVILFDQVGCGRSDKPCREQDYTYERHIGWNIDLLINHLHLKGVTVVLQDWGGLIGTRIVAAHPGAFRRLVIAKVDADILENGHGGVVNQLDPLGVEHLVERHVAYQGRRHDNRRLKPQLAPRRAHARSRPLRKTTQ